MTVTAMTRHTWLQPPQYSDRSGDLEFREDSETAAMIIIMMTTTMVTIRMWLLFLLMMLTNFSTVPEP